LNKITNKFEPITPNLTDEDTLQSTIFEGLNIELATIFPEEEI
jgi:hypothetical protein